LTASPNAGASTARTATLSVAGTGAPVAVTVTQAGDTAAPAGQVVLNDGADFARTTAVTLSVSASDVSGVASMCVTNGTTCTTFGPFTPTRSHTLATGDGAKTVTVWLRDSLGNTHTASAAPRDTIILDGTPPVNGTATFVTGSAGREVRWGGFSDATSGIASYRVVAASGTTPPASCAVGTVVYEGIGTAVADLTQTGGAPFSYRVCALDRAGHTSTGAALIGTALPETNPPTGSITLNAGAAWTRTTGVTVAIDATDASAITGMCISEAATCTTFVTYATSKAFTLSSTNGAKTVRVWLRDQWGNTTPTPLAAQIGLDSVLPTNGSVTASVNATTVNLAWSGFSDATSGVASYRVVFNRGGNSAPSNCASGTVAYTGPLTSFAHTGLTTGTKYNYRVCAADNAGNLSAGTKFSATPR
jgi:hypothetical protein